MNFLMSELYRERYSYVHASSSFPGISMYGSKPYKYFVIPFLDPFLQHKCLNYQLLDHLQVGAVLETASYSPVLRNGHVCFKRNDLELASVSRMMSSETSVYLLSNDGL